MSLYKKIRKLFRKKIINIDKNNIYPLKTTYFLKIIGQHNIIEVHPSARIKGEIIIYGDNNHIQLGNIQGDFNLYLGVYDCTTTGSSLYIGDDTTSNGLCVRAVENNSSIRIGSGCMFSSQIHLWASDTHSVIDTSGILLNYGSSVEIGNHVWVGLDVKIGKNTKISDNTIVGWGSVVTHQFTESNVVIAGNPAVILKRNINWDARRPHKYKEDFLKK